MIATCNHSKTAQSTLTVCTHTYIHTQYRRVRKNNPFNFCSYFNSACNFLIEFYITVEQTNFCWNISEND